MIAPASRRVTVTEAVGLLTVEAECRVSRVPGSESARDVEIETVVVLFDGWPLEDARKRYRWQVTDAEMHGFERVVEEITHSRLKDRAFREAGLPEEDCGARA